MPTIAFFYPKPRPDLNYSIANLFLAVQASLPSQFKAKRIVSTYQSKGFLKRILMSLCARTRQGDVNHVTGDIHFIACFLNRKRTVLTVHDCGFMNHPSPVARLLFKWFWLVLPVWRSAIVTVVSEETKREVLKYTRCQPKKIQVIPNFITERFTTDVKVFNTAKPTILHVGTAPNKNLEGLAEAVAGLSCHLQIIGKLSKKQVHVLKKNSVDYSNMYNVDEEGIISAYRQCDILCFVSTLEGFGLPILEAQAIGRPVITSNLSAMPEVAGDAACLVDPFDVESIRQGIETVITNIEYREKLVAKGFENARRFNRKATIEKYVNVYAEILDNKSKADSK